MIRRGLIEKSKLILVMSNWVTSQNWLSNISLLPQSNDTRRLLYLLLISRSNKSASEDIIAGSFKVPIIIAC